MKALTIWQPWAALVMMGEKHFETRSWETKHRGPLAIHAGTHSGHVASLALHPGTPNAILAGLRRTALPYGVILGIVELVRCVPAWQAGLPEPLSPTELALGNFTRGRFAWELRVLEVFEHPIPARGRQGLWTWDRKESETR